jgi:TRAP-type C4-dicarboxylate transport system substrate-binding protein
MAEMLIVRSKVADYVKSKNMQMGSDTYDALSAKVQASIDEAIKRCADNGRKTLKPYDL